VTQRRTTALKRLINRPEIAFLMEAHSGLSARIVEETGFEGIWGSGLTIAAAFGVRDNNELSWSQVVDQSPSWPRRPRSRCCSTAKPIRSCALNCSR
jgi:2-methylisocitrate lyase-like PEP mutase family enzyme